MQSLLVGILLIVSGIYLGRMIYKSFASSPCENGCGKCSTINVDNIVKSIENKQPVKPTL